ncbi:MAG: hypothetical protein AB7E60_07020 [Sphingobium sp.]
MGTISATIDGQELTWDTKRATIRGEANATAEFDDAGFILIHDDKRGQGPLIIVLNHNAATGRITLSKVDPFPAGLSGPCRTSVDTVEQPDISFTTLNRDGAEGRAAGRFTAGQSRKDCVRISTGTGVAPSVEVLSQT